MASFFRASALVLIFPVLLVAESRDHGPKVTLGAPLSVDDDAKSEQAFRSKLPEFAIAIDEWASESDAGDLSRVRRSVGKEIDVPGVSISIKKAAAYLEANQPRIYRNLVRDVVRTRNAGMENINELNDLSPEEEKSAAITGLARIATFSKTKSAFEQLQLHIFAEERGLTNVKIEPPPARGFVGKLIDRTDKMLHRNRPAPSGNSVESRSVEITGGPLRLVRGSIVRGASTKVTLNGQTYHLNRAGQQVYAELLRTSAGINRSAEMTKIALQAHQAEEDRKAAVASVPARKGPIY